MMSVLAHIHVGQRLKLLSLGEEFGEDPAFADVMIALRDAIAVVRNRVEDYKRQIEPLLARSDSPISSLEARDARRSYTIQGTLHEQCPCSG